MKDNDIWDLIELRNSKKPIGCKWMFKTKLDLKGNFENIRHVLSQRKKLKESALTIRRFSPGFHEEFFQNYHGTSGSLQPGVTPNGC